jgi:hypothetical protein
MSSDTPTRYRCTPVIANYEDAVANDLPGQILVHIQATGRKGISLSELTACLKEELIVLTAMQRDSHRIADANYDSPNLAVPITPEGVVYEIEQTKDIIRDAIEDLAAVVNSGIDVGWIETVNEKDDDEPLESIMHRLSVYSCRML